MRDTGNIPTPGTTPGHIVRRNVRHRYPWSSDEVTDTMDEIYNASVELLGYQNEEGIIVVSGSLRSLWASLDDDRAGSFGTSPSGVTQAYCQASGTSTYSVLWNKEMKLGAMIQNVI